MIDHLVLATDDLQRTVVQIAAEWGIIPTPGGAHVGHGTRNELVGIGGGSYLEVIGPDFEQRDHTGARPFGIDQSVGERLVTWCARPAVDIDLAAAAALVHGHDVGQVTSMSRRRPDGVLLSWRLSLPAVLPDRPGEPAVLPFLIDWLRSEHPSASLDHPVELTELELHTDAGDHVRAVLGAIGDDPRISVRDIAEPRPRLVARLRTPAGDITLSG
jgi:Glyoxalase-like domain